MIWQQHTRGVEAFIPRTIMCCLVRYTKQNISRRGIDRKISLVRDRRFYKHLCDVEWSEEWSIVSIPVQCWCPELHDGCLLCINKTESSISNDIMSCLRC